MKQVLFPEVVWFQEGPGVRNTQYTDSGVKLLNVANLVDGRVDLSNTDRYISEEEAYGKYKHFLVDDGDFIIASSGIKVEYFDKKMGFVSGAQLPLCMNTSTIRFKVLDKNILDVRYFMYFLKTDQFKQQLSREITGSAQLNFGPSHLKKMHLPLIDLTEQRKIAAVLDKVSDLIAKRHQQLTKLDELVKARFVEMFGDFKRNTMGWPVVGFKEIAIIDGTMTTDYKKYANYPHIGIDSIEKDTGKLIGYKTVAEDGVISGKYVFTPKHIIYSKIRPNLNKVALPEFEGLCSADAYPILPIAERCNRTFLAYNMRSKFFLDYILQFCNRTNLPKVNRKEVSGFETPLPPIELQNQFATFVEQTEKTRNTISRSLDKLETLKKALMQEYFG